MIVTEQFSEIRDGRRVTGRREVDMPGVLSDEDAARRQTDFEREQTRNELRTQMQMVLAEEALGLDVTERKRALCDAFAALR